MRQLVKEIVNSDPDLDVVDTAENLRIAIQKASDNPDAVLLDIDMPEMTGLAAAARPALALQDHHPVIPDHQRERMNEWCPATWGIRGDRKAVGGRPA